MNPHAPVYPGTSGTFGARLLALRLQRGWTQAQLADYAGIKNTTVYVYEHNKGGITLYTMIQLAEAFGISVSELLDGVEVAA